MWAGGISFFLPTFLLGISSDFAERKLPDIRSPHQFVAKCVKEDVVVSLHYLDAVVGTGDVQAGALFA